MNQQEEALEAKIQQKWNDFSSAIARGDVVVARGIQVEFFDLIGQRTPERVVEMEREKGLF